jgi:hypothetical protein
MYAHKKSVQMVCPCTRYEKFEKPSVDEEYLLVQLDFGSTPGLLI